MKKFLKQKVVDLEKLNKVGIQKFFIWPPKQYENHNRHHFPVEITEISVEITEISFFEFEFSFRSELAKFGEISAEFSFPAVGGIR